MLGCNIVNVVQGGRRRRRRSEERVSACDYHHFLVVLRSSNGTLLFQYVCVLFMILFSGKRKEKRERERSDRVLYDGTVFTAIGCI